MPANQQNVSGVTEKIDKMNLDEMQQVRRHLDNRISDQLPNEQGSADVSADDEKKKYIAQHGQNPLDQERAQDVPMPVTDEVKDLQNDMAEREHQAKGGNTTSESVKRSRIEEAGEREGVAS